MNWKNLAIAAAAASALLGGSSAFAHQPHWAPAHGWHAKHKHKYHYYKPRPVVVYAPAPVYYYYAPLRYYAPPRPVIYGHIPVNPDLRVSFGMRF